MHLCMSIFPTILEYPGMLFNLLKNTFAYSKFLYDDLIEQNKVDDLKNYFLSFVEKNQNLIISDKDPFTLMDEAGYILYECKSEKEIINFMKYYQPKERLCTFYNHRLYDHHVFFAVKKNVDAIKREDFISPYREDEYGTSVISIQFTKGKINSLSIKNRYNHTVDNPDATFSNNLDNIIPGLTDSFQKMYHLNIFPEENTFTLFKYCSDKYGRLYKYNYEFDDLYFCVNNAIIDRGIPMEYEKEKYLIIDYFIIDLVNKKIKLYDNFKYDDGFVIDYPINKIQITCENFGKKIEIIGSDFFINLEINKFNHIISYESNIKEIGDDFLYYNKTLEAFINNNLEKVGADFLPYNNKLDTFEASNIKEIGNGFLEQNEKLLNVNLPNLLGVGDSFLRSSKIKKINLPNLSICGSNFLSSATKLIDVSLPSLKKVGNYFLFGNLKLLSINLENVEEVGSFFLSHNYDINKVMLPKLKIVGDSFLANCVSLQQINLPEALIIGNNFLISNRLLKNVNAPNLIRVGNAFLLNNILLERIDFPNLRIVGNNFLYSNSILNEVQLPKLEEYGTYFLFRSRNLLKRSKEKEEKKLVKKNYI